MSVVMREIAMAADATPGQANTNRTFAVRGYSVEGNTVLPPGAFGVLTNYTGANVNLLQVRNGLGELQLEYEASGFPTVAVTLPQQKVTNGMVRVQIVEGRLSAITIKHNRWFSLPNVLRALPGLETNILLNTRWLQPELDRANANSDRQIYPAVNPGLEPGSTELELRVEDRLPLHGHIEVNDKSTPQTPLLRLDTSLQYNNLWQYENQIGVDYNFSPQEMKPAGTPFSSLYDAPAVASYSGFYRIPLHFGEDFRSSYEQTPVSFGYNEVTHQFNLPSPMGTPEWVFFASRSATDTGYNNGPRTIITNSATLDVDQQSVQRNPSATEDVGTKFTLPLAEFLRTQSSLNFGVDYKYYQSSALDIHYTFVSQYSTNPPAPPVLVQSGTVTNYHNSANSVFYFPLSLGWSGSRPDNQGSFAAFCNQNVFLPALESARRDFQQVAGSTAAGGLGTTVSGGLTRQQNLPANWVAIFNLGGQWASEPLIANEQFALGGTGGVRGYREGETYGDTGWRAQFDLRAPAVNVGFFPTENDEIPAELRCSWFMDYGQASHWDSTPPDMQQWGTGLGFYLTAGEHFSARLTLGWALLSTVATSAGSAQGYFSVGFQF